ncbi:hypothetical protein DICPUDRAFT_27887 [Dictyostelium purpureum]|uniref:Iron hydrogenase small subunit domain-containing protein n=1 Tax=Dictyostelium purpureum TaxID=5786 RepID=F0ZB08_DICPU|nr:uncharacterized protein DICPUDRAFT_27887 [Dictyostelium purpureum]EGC38890.1 hypothetical protein DICPUDRAFT_27887 [Dictyostelium purpureum]|eukprot:XP_003284570.1 hypothetical protein DICPUDRAFT_27887 [Dictyostelium purpureum]
MSNKSEDRFSSVLKLTEFDYIVPSQICIKPVETPEKSNDNGNSKIEIESNGRYVEISEDGTKKQLEKATITLNDCLACSGCITSAESVLITAQSIQEFLSNINSNTTDSDKKTIVVTLSPQSRASLAAYYKISTLQVIKKLKTFFKSLNIDYLFDSSFSRDFSLLESAAEFVARYKKQLGEDQPLPMLSSACPGWICYAEKTHGDYILPYISTTKSPQQIMGTLVKYYFSKKINIEPSNIYHVTIMPCYDKKLEASRNDFYNDIFKTKDVDCVLSTSEILDLFKEKNTDFIQLEESTEAITSEYFNINQEQQEFYGVKGSSGGYLEFVFRYAAKELFNVDVNEIEYKVGRNQDFKEVSLEVNGEKVLNFALAYGFRNIQNIVRKIKTNTTIKKESALPYHFVEIMACPSGCINGGGQIKQEGIKENKAFLLETEENYNQQIIRNPQDNPQVQEIYKNWLNGCFSHDAITKLHTQYHRIEKTTNALNIKW